MKKRKQWFLSLCFYALSGFGISLSIFATIGVSSFNSLNLSLASLANIKVGNITMLTNIVFLMLYALLSKFKEKKQYYVQFLALICFGFVINFFTYSVLNHFVLKHYYSRLVVFVSGAILAGIGTGMVLNLRVLAFPIESVCHLLAQRWQVPFMNLRYGVDLISITLSILISFIARKPYFVREGTLLSFLILSYTISHTKRIYERKGI